MAKFCGNCGTELEDSANICGKCGTPLDGTLTDIPNLKISDPEKQEKIKKIVKGVFALAVVVVVAVIAFNVISQFIGYNGLIRKVVTAYEEYDIDTITSLSSDMYYYDEDYWFEYNVSNNLDSFESSVGHNYKLSYEVNEIYTLSEHRMDQMISDIEDLYPNFDVSIIEEIVVADLTITAKQGNKSVDNNINITMSKENGKWKLLYIE